MKRRMLRVSVAAVAMGLSTGMLSAQGLTSADKSFIGDTLQDNLAEVNFAKLALSKSGDKNVREFAEKMVRDHEMMNKDVFAFAKKINVKESTGPTLMDRIHYEDLKAKSGISFDRAYVELMVKDHHADLKTMIDERDKTTDPALKALVTSAEGVIKMHTMMIDNIARMGGIDVPAMPAGA